MSYCLLPARMNRDTKYLTRFHRKKPCKKSCGFKCKWCKERTQLNDMQAYLKTSSERRRLFSHYSKWKNFNLLHSFSAADHVSGIAKKPQLFACFALLFRMLRGSPRRSIHYPCRKLNRKRKAQGGFSKMSQKLLRFTNHLSSSIHAQGPRGRKCCLDCNPCHWHKALHFLCFSFITRICRPVTSPHKLKLILCCCCAAFRAFQTLLAMKAPIITIFQKQKDFMSSRIEILVADAFWERAQPLLITNHVKGVQIASKPGPVNGALRACEEPSDKLRHEFGLIRMLL